MKWFFSIILGSIGKQIGAFLFGWIKKLHYIRKGSIRERNRQAKKNEEMRKRADEIREDVDNSNIDDVRDFLRKQKSGRVRMD